MRYLLKGKLRVVPVRMVEHNCELPALLSGRLFYDLNVSRGGVGKMAAELRTEPGATASPSDSNVSVTLRLGSHALIHTLNEVREFTGPNKLSVLMLDGDYHNLADFYWQVSEVQFPPMDKEDPRRLAAAVRAVDEIHGQCRRIIAEVPRLVNAYVSRSKAEPYFRYYESGFERSVRLLLHRLSWNARYLLALRDITDIDEKFLAQHEIAPPFEGHYCNFLEVSGDQMKSFSTAHVPSHGHPYAEGTPLMSWGLLSPFTDMSETEVGEVVGDLAARLYLSQTHDTADLPYPEKLRYGLA